MSRTTTAYASPFFRERVHVVSMYASEKRTLEANFAALTGATPALASATWQTWNPASVFMSAGRIDGNVASITLAAQYDGVSIIRCTVTLDDGTQYVQQFRIEVLAQPYYRGETYQTGPETLTVTGQSPPDDGGGSDPIDGGGA